MHHQMDMNGMIIFIGLLLSGIYIYMSWQTKTAYFRAVLWTTGVILCVSVLINPHMHHDFVIHMYGHLMLGMAGPLLMALSRPLQLTLKAVPVSVGRSISRLMNSRYGRFITHPVTALLLNTGGLWILYRTPLFMMMHHHIVLYYLIHLHIFLAGYLFTAVMLSIEPTKHRYSFKMRSVVMMVSIAFHQILSKSFYPYPPHGVIKAQAEAGAQVMYYGGDIVELVIIFMMCRGWYYSVRPEKYKQTI